MTNPVNPPSRPGVQPEDELRKQGTELVTLISAVIRIGRAYSVTNQVFRTQLGNIAAALRPILETSGEAVFVVLNSDLYLNGARVPVSTSSFRFHQTVTEAFKSRGISGIRLERGVGVDDLGKFFDLFLQPTCPHGAAMLKECADQNLQRIQPAVHASTTRSVGHATADWEEEVETQPEGGPGRPRFARESETSRDDLAQQRYTRSYHATRSLLTTTALSGGLEMRHAKRVIQPLVDGAFASEPIVVGLSRLHEHDEYTYSHAVNVCSVAVTMGHFLGMDRRTLADLGVAALLHDVGKDAVASEIFHPLEAFNDEERTAAERHPLEGARLIAGSTSLNGTTLRCIRVALEHHRVTGRDGYPSFSPRWNVSLLSQTVAVADCYVNLHSRRGDLIENITPYEALGMMLGPLAERFEPALLWALVQSVGFYPPGQIVELDDGVLAVVLSPNNLDLSRPNVRVLREADGSSPIASEPRELLPIPPENGVKRALSGGEYPRELLEIRAA